MRLEVSISTTVVPLIFAIRMMVVPIKFAIHTTVVPIIFAIRTTVEQCLGEEKIELVPTIYVKLGYKFSLSCE